MLWRLGTTLLRPAGPPPPPGPPSPREVVPEPILELIPANCEE